MEELKNKRGVEKARVTRKINEIKKLLDQKAEKEDIDDRAAQLEEAFEGLKLSHLQVVTEVGDDEEEKKQQDEYYKAVETDVDVIRNQVSDYIQPEKVHDQESVSNAGSKRSIRSSISAARIKAASERAVLLAEAKMLKRKQELEKEEFKLGQQRDQLELDFHLAKSLAAEEQLKRLEEEEDHEAMATQPRIPPSGNISHEDDPSTYHGANQLLQQQQRLIDIISAPKVELSPFDGNPLQYWSFIRGFENNVEKVISDPTARLTRLVQYCTGKAENVLQCCLIMEPKAGYIKARELLKERFGNDFVIAKAWIDMVTEGRPIKPYQSDLLQELSDNLHNCKETLQSMGPEYLIEINSQGSLLKIIECLPVYLKNRWRKEAVDIKTKQHRFPKLEDVVKFVKYAALEANDPVFGSMNMSAAKPSSQVSKGQRSNFSTAVEENKEGANQSNTSSYQGHKSTNKCLECGEDHDLFHCDRFKAMEPEVRLNLAKKNRLCFNCLRPNHRLEDCRSERRCKVKGCGRKHTSFLHQKRAPETKSKATDSSQAEPQHNDIPNSASMSTGSSYFTGAGKRIALPIVAVNVRGQSKAVIRTYALLDNGSTNSFCSEDLLSRLGVQGKTKQITLTTLNQENKLVDTKVATLSVSDINDENTVTLSTVYARKQLPINEENIPTPKDIDIYKWPHLRDVTIPQAEVKEVTLLIGQDTPEVLVPSDIKAGKQGEPYATKTLLGWTLNGPLSVARTNFSSYFISTQQNLEEQLEKFWKVETAGLDEKEMSVNDRKVMDLWNETLSVEDGHFQLPIPFKEKSLPNNKVMAQKRLQSLEKKLDKDPELKQKYIMEVTDLLKKGFATEVQNDNNTESQWYLPHHPVLHPQKPGKFRIVFDCAAKYNKVSLNDKVFQGPDLTNTLVGVLMRFRLENVAFMADIEAMFHQVKVASEDQDYLRFLWWPDGDTNQEPRVYKMTVHLFGGTWSPSCCNFALHQTADRFGNSYSKEAKETVFKNFYVDDCLKSLPTVSEAVQVAKQVQQLLTKGGFRLTKFTSNSREMLDELPEVDRAKHMKILMQEAIPVERALGVYWNIANDTLSYKISEKEKPLTKRGMLSILCSVYDPLGFASPVILKAKKILQDLSQKKVPWDTPVPDEQRDQWQKWKQELKQMEGLQINRCVKPKSFGVVVSRQLHHFSDASEVGYGVTSYLRLTDKYGHVHCSLIMGRSRLAPLKKLTIPRLELSAATLAVKQDGLLRRELSMEVCLEESQFWTDSMIVLQYINNEDKRFHTFVANRVQTIHNGSSPNQWQHIPSKLNPADHVSRGLTAEDLINTKSWIEGPTFLHKECKQWPNVSKIPTLMDDPEVKQVYSVKATETATDKLITYFSSWKKLKKAVAWIIAIKEVLTKKGKPISKLESQHINHAETVIIKYVQRQCFSNELQVLETSKVSKSSPLHSLEPVLIDGVICITGRMKNAPEYITKHQVILPKAHHVVELLIRHSHEASGHAGREFVLADLRQNYWMIDGRRAIRMILNKCIACKKRDGQPCQQKMADLPSDRVTPGDPAFTYVGVDYFGPFLVKRGRGTDKRYGCLFTCLAIRGVHIEIAHSLDTSSFINCLQRFMARRGKPKQIRSDNGTNFVGGEREIREATEEWDMNTIQDTMNDHGIEWKFNPPGASHMGGVWERQIKSIRRILAGLTKEQVLHEESLNTLMCLVESIINNRPLTTVSTDPKDLEPLTPNHLLLLRPVQNLYGLFDGADLYSRSKWRQVQYMADIFWKRWIREYLPKLQIRSKWTDDARNLECGDVVLIMDTSVPRNTWVIGRVVSAMTGDGGKVRTIRVKTKGGVLTRPISKVCLLEANKDEAVQIRKDMDRGTFTSEE